MSKLKNKILVGLAVFIVVLGIGLKCFADVLTGEELEGEVLKLPFVYKYKNDKGETKETDKLLPAEKRAFYNKTQEEFRRWIENDDNLDKWLNNDNFIGQMLGSDIIPGGDNTQLRYNYCIDPTTPVSTAGANFRKLEYIIDVNNIDDMSIYTYNKDKSSKNYKSTYQYLANQNRFKKTLLTYSYIGHRAMSETNTEKTGKTGQFKRSLAYYLYWKKDKFVELSIKDPYWWPGHAVDATQNEVYERCILTGEEYANAQLSIKLKDKTNKDKVKAKKILVDGKTKTYIGPYKVAYDGEDYWNKKIKLKDIKVTLDGKTKTYSKCATELGGDLKDISKLPKEGKNFYIVIDDELNEKNVFGNIEIRTNEYTMIHSRMALVRGGGDVQNYIVWRSKKENTDLRVYLPQPPIPEEEPELKIKKVDADDKTKVLPGVGFKIKHLAKGYVKQSGTKITYTDDEKQATVFITDDKGLITIKGLSKGWYIVTETINPYKEYEKNIGKRKVIKYEGDSDSTEPVIIENKKETETKVIVKKVGRKNDGTIEILPGVGFKLKSDKYAYVVQNSENKIEYTTNINDATTFYSEADGRTTIKNLPMGKYTFIETVNPYSNYALNIGMEKEIEFKEPDEEQVVENKEDERGTLTVVKMGNKGDGSMEWLPNVGFKLKHETEGWVIGTNTIEEGKVLTYMSDATSYTSDRNLATTFFTDNDPHKGIQIIRNLKYGNYTFYETNNPNPGYEANVGRTTTKLLNSSSDSLLVINPLDGTGNLRILKKDEDSGTPLGGVHFKLYSKIFSGYVKKTDSGISYTSYWEEATNFITSAGTGLIEIEGLPAGDYILYETYNANPGYETYPNLRFNIMVKEKSTTTWTYEEKGNISKKGNLKIIKEDEEKKTRLANVSFTVKNNSNECYIRENGDKIEYVNDESNATTFTTNELGEIEIEGLIVGNYTLHETYNGNKGYETYPVNKYFDATVTENTTATIEWSESYVENTPKLGKVTIEKKLEDTDVLMGEIGIILQNTEEGYVVQTDGEIEYVEDKDEATVFYTGTEGENKGKVTIEGLLLGNYNLYEVENNYYGFEINSDEAIKVVEVKEGDESPETVDNKQKYIKLRGYVWEEYNAGKASVPNDQYDEGIDSRKSDVVVNLKEGDTVINTTTTNDSGVYEFRDVLVEKLKDYYIEFEYDGLTYTNVKVNINKDNGSKAAEPSEERQKFNEKFATIERGDKEDRTYGVAKDPSGNPTLDLKYDYADHKAIIDKDKITNHGEEFDSLWGGTSNPLLITANTNEASYSIKDKYDELSKTQIVEYIDNINLGIYEREQPDIALVKDIQNVRLSINGYEHTYEYANRFNHPNQYVDASGNSDMFNVGVKFGTEYSKMKYTRPIYESDYTTTDFDSATKELQVYITYKIQLKNEATSIRTIVNSIDDYYDANYTLTAVGRSVNERGMVADEITDINDVSYDDNYRKLTIKTNADLGLGSSSDGSSAQDIYIQFKIDRSKVAELLKDKKEGDLSDEDKLLDNIVEINSYSPRDKDEKCYAGIDEDSAPGNIDIYNTDTWEDDTDKAPALQLEVAKARELSGIVFEDKTEDGLHTGKIREGNGEYLSSDNDKLLSGVEVKLVGIDDDTGREYFVDGASDDESSITKDDGSFVIKGFIPGDYKIVYTWGENQGGLDVQDYKGTIYVDQKRETDIKQATEKNESDNPDNIENKDSKVYKWYKEDNEYNNKNYSDAIDNYDTRKKIDGELKTKIYSSKITPGQTMDSSTPEMKIGVEYDDKAFTEYDKENGYTYAIKNIDFGIVRRAKQSVELDKRVSSMTVTLANGQVVSEVNVTEDESGKRTLEGENQKHVTYMGPLASTQSPGFVKIELDNELLQGSKVEVTYEFKFENKSEVDVINENYYKFGSVVMNEGAYPLNNNSGQVGKAAATQIVTIKPTSIVDYLDRNWGYEKDRNTNWNALTKEEFESVKGNLIDEAVFGRDSDINDRIILTTSKWRTKDDIEYKEDRYVYPEDNVITNLNVSKTLTTTDDISLKNETEITQLDKPGGATIVKEVDPGEPEDFTPGNHIPGKTPDEPDKDEPGTDEPGTDEPDTDIAETVIVTPSTGANLEFVVPITIAVIALVILGTGIVLIKKKVIDIKK